MYHIGVRYILLLLLCQRLEIRDHMIFVTPRSLNAAVRPVQISMSMLRHHLVSWSVAAVACCVLCDGSC
jgi:hypothetical protein